MNHKRVIKIIGGVIVLAVGLFFLLYTGKIAYRNGSKHSVESGLSKETSFVELEHGMSFEVPFVSEYDVIQGLSFYFRFDQLASMSIYYDLQDAETGETLATGSATATSLMMVDYTTFPFLAPVTGVSGRKLVAHISFAGVMEHPIYIQTAADASGRDVPMMKVTVAGTSRFMYAYIIIFALLTAALLWTYIVGVSGKLHAAVKPEFVYLVLGVLIGAAFLIMIPTGVTPDEPTHIANAYKVSARMMGYKADKPGVLPMRESDAMQSLLTNDVHQAGIEEYYRGFTAGLKDGKVIYAEAATTGDPTRMYILPGLGITVGRLLGLGTIPTYMLGRLLNAIWFVILIFFAIRLIPFGKYLVMVWALLPITLQQACSFSYDAFVNPLCVLIVAATLHLLYDTEKKRRTAKVIVLIALSLVLLPCKQYALSPIALFPLILLFDLWKRKKAGIREGLERKIPHYRKLRTAAILLLVMLAAAGAFFVVRLLTRPDHLVGAKVNYNGLYGEELSNAYSLGHFILHPKDLINLLLNTFWIDGDTLLYQMLGGRLGWININLPWACCVVMLILMMFAAVRRDGEEILIRKEDKVWFLLVSALVFGFTVMGMLLHWTPETSRFIVGIQGRYFLPFLVPLLLVIRSKRTTTSRTADRVIPVVLVANLTVMVTGFFLQVV